LSAQFTPAGLEGTSACAHAWRRARARAARLTRRAAPLWTQLRKRRLRLLPSSGDMDDVDEFEARAA
jgi:hypothetical protein